MYLWEIRFMQAVFHAKIKPNNKQNVYPEY